MKIHTKIMFDWDGNILEDVWYEYQGPLELCCDAEKQQQQALATSQTNFYNTMANESDQIFGLGSQLATEFQQEFGPMFQAGPWQQGWNPAMAAAVNSNIVTTQGEATQNAINASLGQTNALGGGNEYTPQGATKEIQAGINVAGEEATAQEQNQALIQNYEQGNQNFWQATQALAGIPSMEASGSTQMATAANQGGAAAGNTLQNIAQSESGWMNVAGAALGAGATLGAAALGKPPTPPCWIAAAVFGEDFYTGPRVQLVRAWLHNVYRNSGIVPRILMALYQRFGERVACLVRRSSILRKLFSIPFNAALDEACVYYGMKF
jgi:hypothetical protein